MDFGELIRVTKGKSYAGKSKTTNKALYHTVYTAWFFQPGEKVLGFAGSKKPYTFEFSNKSQKEFKGFLVFHGYSIDYIDFSRKRDSLLDLISDVSKNQRDFPHGDIKRTDYLCEGKKLKLSLEQQMMVAKGKQEKGPDGYKKHVEKEL